MAKHGFGLDNTGDEGDDAEEEDESDWVVFNVSFGIPLFDARVNRHICEQILEQNLFDGPSLDQLIKSHRRESLELLNFIARHQALPFEIDRSLPGKLQVRWLG